VIGQCCNFHSINSTVEISWDIFIILANYCLLHLVNNVAIHIYTHDYIRMEIHVTVVYLKISGHQHCPFNGVIFTVQCINSTVEIAWDIFRIYLADYRLLHFVNNVAIHIYAHDYIRMEITVLDCCQIDKHKHTCAFILQWQHLPTNIACPIFFLILVSYK
jgi:hypothetical protein